MAVPKKKRSKQIVKSRRFMNKLNILKSKNISINNYSNFSNEKNIFQNSLINVCSICTKKRMKSLCLYCYQDHFKGTHAFKKIQFNKKHFY